MFNFAKTLPLKRLLTISFILLLTAPFAVPLFYLHFQKKQVRKEVKEMIIEGMDRKDLVLLKFSVADSQRELQWHHSREFEYKGGMYDIVESVIHGDSISYWCWLDKKEMKINEQIDKSVARALADDPQKKESRKNLMNYLKVQYISNNFTWKPIHEDRVPCVFSEKLSFYHSIISSPPVPPPKSA